MANSTVQYENLDEEFPIAGQDNDSQGFRDNFSITKTALQNAASELTDLLTNGARKDVDNDFNNILISNAKTNKISQTVYNTGNLEVDSNIEWTDGAYQNVTVGIDPITLILGAWPENGTYGKIRMALRSNANIQRDITLLAANTGIIRTSPNWPATLRVTSSSTPVFVDAWTSDGGSTVFLEYLGEYSTV